MGPNPGGAASGIPAVYPGFIHVVSLDPSVVTLEETWKGLHEKVTLPLSQACPRYVIKLSHYLPSPAACEVFLRLLSLLTVPFLFHFITKTQTKHKPDQPKT